MNPTHVKALKDLYQCGGYTPWIGFNAETFAALRKDGCVRLGCGAGHTVVVKITYKGEQFLDFLKKKSA